MIAGAVIFIVGIVLILAVVGSVSFGLAFLLATVALAMPGIGQLVRYSGHVTQA